MRAPGRLRIQDIRACVQRHKNSPFASLAPMNKTIIKWREESARNAATFDERGVPGGESRCERRGVDGADGGLGRAQERESIHNHVAEVYFILAKIPEGMLERAGFRIVRADYIGGGIAW